MATCPTFSCVWSGVHHFVLCVSSVMKYLGKFLSLFCFFSNQHHFWELSHLPPLCQYVCPRQVLLAAYLCTMSIRYTHHQLLPPITSLGFDRNFTYRILTFCSLAACSSSLNSCLFWVSVFVKCPVCLSWVTRKQHSAHFAACEVLSNGRTLTDPGRTLEEATWLTLHHSTHTSAHRRAICWWESWPWGLYFMQLFALVIRWELKFDMIWESPLYQTFLHLRNIQRKDHLYLNDSVLFLLLAHYPYCF